MAEIKPAEVSAILRQQLAGFKSVAELEETGTYSRLVTELPVFSDYPTLNQESWLNLKKVA